MHRLLSKYVITFCPPFVRSSAGGPPASQPASQSCLCARQTTRTIDLVLETEFNPYYLHFTFEHNSIASSWPSRQTDRQTDRHTDCPLSSLAVGQETVIFSLYTYTYRRSTSRFLPPPPQLFFYIFPKLVHFPA